MHFGMRCTLELFISPFHGETFIFYDDVTFEGIYTHNLGYLRLFSCLFFIESIVGGQIINLYTLYH